MQRLRGGNNEEHRERGSHNSLFFEVENRQIESAELPLTIFRLKANTRA